MKNNENNNSVTFSRKSLIFFGAGLLSGIIGYILLAAGDIMFAPIFLVLGYVVFIPIAILKK